MATTKQINDFINLIAPIVVEICKSKNRKVLPSVCIAQACNETGYGTTERMMKTNGLFGIKVGRNAVRYGKAWKGKSYSTKTKEYYGNKTEATIIKDYFRAYDTIRESIEDYYDLLGSCSRYSGCIGVTDYTKSITAIVNGGYATGPTYINTVCSIIKKRNLTKYDDCMTHNIKNTNVAVANAITNTRYKLNEKVTVTRYFSNSNADDSTAIIRCRPAVIGKIKEGAKHPYLVYSVDGKALIGWCGDNNILDNISNPKSETYTVVSGDTMSKIAKEYSTTPAKLVEINKSKYPNIKVGFIRVGWVLRVS